jgi:hypothetical protein
MYVYDTNDIVSNELRGTQHAWESSEINQMLWALQQHQHVQQLLISQGKPPAAAVPLMVDIGANIGWWVLPSCSLLCTSWWFHLYIPAVLNALIIRFKLGFFADVEGFSWQQ